ncbi:MAG: 3-phosphoshikimate 1-carboxyvinyltransferase [Phycisphaerae bacterium]|nr:3-phosphoshikimate 1-carboxyvinyltransferase [Phycisphaerae bacterium]
MKLKVKKSRLVGTVLIPASKSHTIRAVAIASLANGRSDIQRPLISSDTMSCVECYRAMGAKIDTMRGDFWRVTGTAGNVQLPDEPIDVGNSGTTLRLAVGSAALSKTEKMVVFTGDEQIQSRPIAPLLDSLNDLGAQCRSIKGNGKAPVKVGGTIRGGKTTIECKTSQYLSSLLMCAPLAGGDTKIEVSLLNEPGYVQMTLDWLDKQGIKYTNHNMKTFEIPGGQKYKDFDEAVPADFSSATFFLCTAALFGDEVILEGLDFSDSQPDKAVVDYLLTMGADIETKDNSVVVRGSKLHGIDIDMNATPDALPAMAVTAAFAEGRTKLYNVPQARTKETDRIACMAAELKKMGVFVEELADGLIIQGGAPMAAAVKGWGDHRIVMAMAIAGLGTGDVEIDTAEAMRITFPNFVELMAGLGAKMEIVK